MAYTAKTWVTGEVIQAVDLNHAEQGIATAQSGVDAISAPGAIGTANLADGAVTRAKLADAALADIAAEYSSSKTYAVGDYVFHSGALYRCTTAITTAEAWTAAHWTAAVLGDDVADLKSAFDVYGAANRILNIDGTYYPGSLTLVYKGESITVSGSPTGSGYTHSNRFNSNAGFPDGITAGMTLQITQVCNNNNIRFRFFEYVNGSESMIADIPGNGTAQVNISSNATGCIIRTSIAKGQTYNNVITKQYILVTLTKQQIEAKIGGLDTRLSTDESEISEVKSLMPQGYVSLDTTSTDGLVNKYNQVAGTDGYAYIKQAVLKDEKYKVSGYYYGGNYPAYLLLNNDSVTSFQNADETGAFIGMEVTIPANVTHIVVNGYTTSPAKIQKWSMIKAGSAEARDSVIVGVGTEYTYNNINTAIGDNPGSVICVDYGRYETEIQNLATDKKIIGKDVNLCIMTGTAKDYDTPPIEIAGGIIKHFTVNMVNDESASHKGYCLHSDNAACASNTLIVEDCKFTCEGQHTIGMGIYPGEEVIYKDCEFIFADEELTPEHASFFAHNSGASDGTAIVRFHNCIFRGSGYALKLSSYSSNCIMQFEFIDCTFESDTLTGDVMIWTDYVAGETHDQDNLHRFKGKMPLMKTSHGNNVSIANYAT